MKRHLVWSVGAVGLHALALIVWVRSRQTSPSPSAIQNESWPPQRLASVEPGIPPPRIDERVPASPLPREGRKFGSVYPEIRNLEDWMKAVKKTIAGCPAGTPENGKFGRTLAHLLSSDPAQIPVAFAAILNDPELPFEGRCLTVEAIAAAAIPSQAHALLLSLAQNPALGEAIRMAVFGAMTWPQEAPGAATTEYLFELSKGSGRNALLAADVLGMISRDLRVSDPTRCDELIDRLYLVFEEHRKNGAQAGMGATMEAMGASRNTRVEPILRQGLRDPQPAVRASALRGLALFDPPDRYAAVASVFLSDPDPKVRISAISALQPVPGASPILQSLNVAKIPPEVRSTLVNALALEKDVEVRRALLQFWAHCYQGTEARAPEEVYEGITRVAASDPSPQLKARAKDMLKSLAGFRR